MKNGFDAAFLKSGVLAITNMLVSSGVHAEECQTFAPAPKPQHLFLLSSMTGSLLQVAVCGPASDFA